MTNVRQNTVIEIPEEILTAATALLAKYYPQLTPSRLADTLGRSNEDTGKEQLLSRKEAARKLAVSVATIDRLIDSKQIRVVRIRRSVRVPASSLSELIAVGKYGSNTSQLGC